MSVMKLNIEDECTDSYSGQTNHRLQASIIELGKSIGVGYIDYVIFRGEVSISMIEVAVDRRRQGVATRLLQHLQSNHPDQDIAWGVATPEGSALQVSITHVFGNADHDRLTSELRLVQEQLLAQQKAMDAFHTLPNPTDQARERILAASDYWNQLHDRECELQEVLRETPSQFRRIRMPGHASVSQMKSEAFAPCPVPRNASKVSP